MRTLKDTPPVSARMRRLAAPPGQPVAAGPLRKVRAGKRAACGGGRWLRIVLLAGCCASACVPVRSGSGVVGPGDAGDLRVVASTESPNVIVGATASLTAEGSGGSRPYQFRWDLNGGPTVVELDDVTSTTLVTPELTAPGRYVFRVTITDAEGRTETDFIAVQVGEAVTVSLRADSAEVFEGDVVTLTADATGEGEPFSFAWDLQSGPVELDLSDATESELTPEPLTAFGTYVFRVTVTDAQGFSSEATTTVTVQEAVTLNLPPLAVVGEPVELTAELETPAADVSVRWEVIEGEGTIDDGASLTPRLSATSGTSLRIRLTLTVPSDGGGAQVSREADVIVIDDARPRVTVQTSFGGFTLELNADAAPRHAANFLRYVDEMFYDGLLFHRNACQDDPQTGECVPFVLQGGGYERIDGELTKREPTHDPVTTEANNGLSNSERYTVSLALSGGDPNSGTSQFFINLGDNRFLDVQGFTVFGTVAAGRDVVDAIVATERTDNPVIPGEVSLPVEDVIMEQVRREGS